MRTRIALLLLLTLSLTLGLGTHPCGAATEEHPSAAVNAMKAPAAVPPCHARMAHHAPAPQEPAPKPGHCGSEPGADHRCPHLCHATALPVVAPPVPTLQAVAELDLQPVESALAAPMRSIDHVPLT
ncbi:MAG TPA: hypothetical protein VKM72_33530 [Thermoanaerobaculia bacterium]|nr:hypothetical protein [Thermoanaerobaculia bacterium]